MPNPFFSPHIALFGQNARSLLVNFLIEKQYNKALVITDANLFKLGITEKLLEVLQQSNLAYAVFTGVEPNPTVKNVHDAFDVFQKEGCDLVITVGGGSPQDCGKAVAVLAKNPGDILTYVRDKKKTSSAVDVIAVSTTSGTGSECTYSYVITDTETHSKYGCRDIHIQPMIAINDSDLLVGLPKSITAGTGMDALTHAVETLIGRQIFPLTRELAFSACRLIFEYLPKAVENGADVSARDNMAAAQYLAGLAFGNCGVGLVHSMSHQLSAVFGLPHGLANAILLPKVIDFEKQNCLPQLGELARVLWADEAKVLSDEEGAALVVRKLNQLSEEVGTSVALSKLGVSAESLEMLAEKTLLDGSFGNSARLASKDEIIAIYQQVL